MDLEHEAVELDSSCNSPCDEAVNCLDVQIQDPEMDPGLVFVPSGNHLMSGLLGLNVVLLGAALVAGEAFNPEGLKHQEPHVFMLLLMGVSLVWMLWYLLWARKQPGICPHKDHHAGGVTTICKYLSITIMTGYKRFVLDRVMKFFFSLLICSGPHTFCCIQSSAVYLQNWVLGQYNGVSAGG